MASTKANLMALIVIIVLTALFIELKPQSDNVPQGILLPSKIAATPSDASVVVFANYPARYENLGQIHIQLHSMTQSSQAEQQVIAKAQQLAQARGADGIVIDFMLYQSPSNQTIPQFAKYILQATAIKN